MILKAFCVIVNHMCEQHGPETVVFGPFTTREKAEAFMADGLAANPQDDAHVELLGLNSKNLVDVLLGIEMPPGIDIDGPVM